MDEGAVSTRSVKLKVHYTFDQDHKNDHLTKPPHSYEVQTATLDDNNTIGVIELRTCLDIVINASPELTSTTENDFTVYAYDYSEPNTPLVGQGMLSKILGQDGSNDADSEAMVTGKITKNVMGMFSKNAQPNLEVKLRFTPMTNTMSRPRSGSVSSMKDGVQQHWNTLQQSNGLFHNPQIGIAQSPADNTGLEVMQRMLSEGGPPRDRLNSFQAEPYAHGGISRPSSRSGTPMQQNQFNAPNRQAPSQSRPGSRAGVRQLWHARKESFGSGYFSGEEPGDEGPAKKRARITKVDWPAKSDYNIERQPDSLRVVASTASSVRLHRPTPMNPAAALQLGLSLEEPVRPPTPIPSGTGRPRGRPKKKISPNLAYGALARRSSPARQSNDAQESSLSSPEETRDSGRPESTNSTPMNLPSSPPVMPDHTSFVTSPTLPALPNHNDDSGFMSGNYDELFANEDFDFGDFLDVRTEGPDIQQTQFQPKTGDISKYTPVFDEGNDLEEQPLQEMPSKEPTPVLLPPPSSRPLSRAQSFTPSTTSSRSASLPNKSVVPPTRPVPTLLPRPRPFNESPRAENSLPQIVASDPVGRTFHRSNTWAPDMSDAIMSDAFDGSQHRQRSRKRVGKEQTKARLENAIASGEMPPFCDNCGAIETPAWRRGYTKLFHCSWDEVETSLEAGACCYKEPVEYHADGSIKVFKGYKVEKIASDKSDDWTQICLCNPCGLWFHKSKYPRPAEKWQKKDPKEKKRRRRLPKGPKQRAVPPRAAAGTLQSDAQTPASDDLSPADTSAEGADGEDNGDGLTMNGDEAADDGEPQLPPIPTRAASAEPVARTYRFQPAARPLPRQTKSSPIGHGTHAQPIEVDLTPRPIRRVLFPSPENMNRVLVESVPLQEKQNEALLPSFVRRSPRLNKTRDIFAEQPATMTMTVDGEGKENVTPRVGEYNGFDDLFGEDEDAQMLPPHTPTPTRRSVRLQSKTPQRSTREFGDGMSPNVQRSPKLTRTPKGSNTLAAMFLDTVQRTMDPEQMTPFTRSMHAALYDATPSHPQTPRSKTSDIHRNSRTPKRKTPSSNQLNVQDFFDFPDLPSLNDSSPISGGAMAFNFSELTTDKLQTDFDDIFSTEAPMPSSPPAGFFEFLNSHADNSKGGLWLDDTGDGNMGPENDFLSLPQEHHSVDGRLRRSPRKHHAW